MSANTKDLLKLAGVGVMMAGAMVAAPLIEAGDNEPTAVEVPAYGNDQITFWDIDDDGKEDVSVKVDADHCASTWYEIGDSEDSIAHHVEGCERPGVIAQQAAEYLSK